MVVVVVVVEEEEEEEEEEEVVGFVDGSGFRMDWMRSMKEKKMRRGRQDLNTSSGEAGGMGEAGVRVVVVVGEAGVGGVDGVSSSRARLARSSVPANRSSRLRKVRRADCHCWAPWTKMESTSMYKMLSGCACVFSQTSCVCAANSANVFSYAARCGLLRWSSIARPPVTKKGTARMLLSFPPPFESVLNDSSRAKRSMTNLMSCASTRKRGSSTRFTLER